MSLPYARSPRHIAAGVSKSPASCLICGPSHLDLVHRRLDYPIVARNWLLRFRRGAKYHPKELLLHPANNTEGGEGVTVWDTAGEGGCCNYIIVVNKDG